MRIDKQICGAPNLLALPGCGPLMAAKIIAETADSTSIPLRLLRATARSLAQPTWSAQPDLGTVPGWLGCCYIENVAIVLGKPHTPLQYCSYR